MTRLEIYHLIVICQETNHMIMEQNHAHHLEMHQEMNLVMHQQITTKQMHQEMSHEANLEIMNKEVMITGNLGNHSACRKERNLEI